MHCPLCSFKGVQKLIPDYWHCTQCDLRFLDSSKHLNAPEEHERYLLHNNDVNDENYRKFCAPLFEAIVERVPSKSSGLDFGAGAGPIITKQLRELGFDVSLYDPFFHPDESPLSKHYDFVFASEVVEHFFAPAKEFERLSELLKPGGWLAIMTAFYKPEINFDSWYYRRDPTHSAFYSHQTLTWIQKNFNFSEVEFRLEKIALFKKR